MRILTVAHNHSAFHPGGTEVVAETLCKAYGEREGVTSAHLAGVDKVYRRDHSGTFLQGLPGHDDVTLYRSVGFDVMQHNQSRLDGLLFDLAQYLENFSPDVVHIHHLVHFGLDFLVLVKKILPRCKVVMTLHDYYLICANDGLMTKTEGNVLCYGASPDACHGCFPDKPGVVFQVRKLNIQNHLHHVDMFVAPSKFLRSRFVQWGIPGNRIKVIANGRPSPTGPVPAIRDTTSNRNRFGVFGNLRETKGTLVAAEAAARLVEQGFGDFSLEFHGAALFQPEAFTNELESIVARSNGRIRLNGRFDNRRLSQLMAGIDWVMMPSTWWENAPLAIQDAFAHGKPALVSDIGGMSEAVRDGGDGMLVRVGDVSDWMEKITLAASSPTLWNKLSSGVKAPVSVTESADRYMALFQKMISSSVRPSKR